MIQPVSAFTPRAGFRGKNNTYGNAEKGISNRSVALINAGGIAAAAGGLGTALARSQTSSWAHASVLGACAAVLTLFFMTPHILEKGGVHKVNGSEVQKSDAPKFFDKLKERLRPAKKIAVK